MQHDRSSVYRENGIMQGLVVVFLPRF